MAVTFSDLHTEEGIKSLDQFLSGKTYISGDQLTKDDIKVYAAVVEKPGDTFPNAAKWYDVVSSQLAPSFPGHAQGVRFSGAATPSEAAFAKVINGLEMLYFATSPEQRSRCSLDWLREEIGRILSLAKEACRLRLEEAYPHAPQSQLHDSQAATSEDDDDDDDDDLDLFGDETEEDKKAAEERGGC